MKQDQRRRLFSSALTEFMNRAGIGDTELARRIGVARLTVRRWREGNNLPNEETIRKLKSGLRWLDSTAAIHELTNEEVEQLLVTAGRQHLPVRQDVEAERTTSTDRCIVYSARYSPVLFPSRWSTRMIELERSVSGSLYMMWSTLPSITRSPAFYQGAYSRELFQRDKVEAYGSPR